MRLWVEWGSFSSLHGHSLTDSRYEYVRLFEQPDTLLANTWIVVRIDGRGFSKYVRSSHSNISSSQVRNLLVLEHAGTRLVTICRMNFIFRQHLD
jgi:tRNA(His) 5'-end guanylyltransferase